MPIKSILTQFTSSIIRLESLQKPWLGIVTSENEIYLYNTVKQSKEKIVHLNLSNDATLICAFDPLGMQLIFGTDQSKTLHLIDLNQKKIIRRFELDHQHPTAIAFAPDGSHFICGTDEGRVLLWRCDAKTMIARMHSFPEYAAYSTIKPKLNFVSVLKFEGDLLATSGYGGSVVITDYQSQTHIHRLHPGYVRNNALLFYHESLIVGNQNGILLKLDRNGKSLNQRLATPLASITQLLRIGPEPYILVASTHRRLLLIDGEKMQIIHDRYIELDENLTSLCKVEESTIYVGTEKGGIYRFDLEPLNHFESLIKSKAYAEAYLYTQQEPLLQKNKTYEILESIFEKDLYLASLALEKGENEKAKIILTPFLPAKAKEITTLFTAFLHINRLMYLFKQQKFSAFYGLIEQYPFLRRTSVYSQAEEVWENCFSHAQKWMLSGKTKEARAKLQPFSMVNVKAPFIQLLLQHIDVLKSYSKALHSHDYQTLKQLSQHYSIIRKLPSYLRLIAEAGELSPAITDALKDKAFEHAFLLLEELRDVVQYEDDFIRLKNFASYAFNLHRTIQNHHWRSAYHLLDTHPELLILPWGKILEEQWHHKLEQCERYAMIGDLSSIKKELTNLINLQNRYERIGDILRAAYHAQLKQIVIKHSESFERAVNNYCDLFGMDTELLYLLKQTQHQGIRANLQPIQYKFKARSFWLRNIQRLPDHIA
ncbi:MAG: WD40 repeat domain-containing protein [Sulfuricurvum sp.]|nr:WD40 repeat domain-containing protein [Sulfuricurvum sp.]MDD5387387.1 WD40 repeat domain-containing protein [Sulfuricurvum sp.]